ncbi:DUF4376 domain-containing protein [Variovorax paradoxus]|nr:DUF4376 domain-containing protein [Variovorax paradoxus]
MPNFTVYDKRTGEVLRTGSSSNIESDKRQAYHAHEAVYLEHTPAGYYIDLDDREPTPYPERPSTAHIFDYAAKVWVDPRSLTDLKLGLLAAVAERRWLLQTEGLTLPGGVRVKTDQGAIASAISDAELAGLEAVDFKAVSGWVTLSVTQLRDAARAVALHIQACFSAERAHAAAIGALTGIEAALAYDTSKGWPMG